jgi:shikimate dehydrogenase
MNFEYLKLNKETRLVPNIGCPIEAPSTPYIYNPLFEDLDLNCILWPVEVPRGTLKEYLEAAKQMDLKMLVVTMPYKSEIIPLLDEVDETSRIFRSVNTVKIQNGKTFGTGMDGKGCLAALQKNKVKMKGAKVLMLGAGAITGVIGRELALAGVRELTIVNRTLEKADFVADILRKNTSGMEIYTMEMTRENLDAAARDKDLMLQCTSMGFKGSGRDYDYVDFIENLPGHAVVLDVITNPPRTRIIKKADACGLKIIYGINMLLGQAGEIIEYVFGEKPSEAALEKSKQEWARYAGVNLDSI